MTNVLADISFHVTPTSNKLVGRGMKYCVCAGMYVTFVIVLCVLSASSTTLVMYMHIRAESIPVIGMTPWVSRFALPYWSVTYLFANH